MNEEIYKTFEQWMNGNFLEVKEPRKKAYSKDELLLVEMGWNYGYDAGRAVEQAELEATNRQVEILSDALAESRREVAALKINAALDKKAENARELGLDYEPVQEPVAYWIPKAEQFCIADPSGRPFAKAWQPLYTTPPAQPAPVQEHQINQLEKFKNHVLANADELGVVLDAPAAPVQEPVAWKWHQAPVKTSWGHGMVVADLAIDKDNTVSIYCERDQTNKVEAMFTLRKEST